MVKLESVSPMVEIAGEIRKIRNLYEFENEANVGIVKVVVVALEIIDVAILLKNNPELFDNWTWKVELVFPKPEVSKVTV